MEMACATKESNETGEYIDTVFQHLFATPIALPRLYSLASQCAVCRSWPAEQVCGACVNRFAPAQRRCSLCAIGLATDTSMSLRSGPDLCAACARERPPLDATLAAVSYSYPWSTLIAAYKFGEQHGWAGFFARLLLRTDGAAQMLAALDAKDWVVPMPLSMERLESRGFNQSWELAKAVTRQAQTAATADARLLLRLKHTRPQSQLKREARLANVKGAFRVDPLRVPDVEGRRVVLIDDVMTSGASLFTAAEALRNAGASQVSALVLARTAAA